MAWWTLVIDDKEELSEYDREHIAGLIRDGYNQGILSEEEE